MAQSESIPFSHFFLEIKDHTKHEHMVQINPYRQNYYKIDNVYVAGSFENSKFSIEYACNTGKRANDNWLEILYRENIRAGNTHICFYTSVKNDTVKNLADKWHCEKIKIIPNYYSNGEDCIVYECDLRKLNGPPTNISK